MFIDWLTIHQDFAFELPIVSDRAYQLIDTESGEYGKLIQSRFQHEGSFSSFIAVSISGNRITVSGNPSRYNRPDNLFGLTTIDSCVSVFNGILSGLGLPEFTKCTKIFRVKQEAIKITNAFSDGAKITRLDLTSNISTGEGNEQDYIAALSTLNYRYSIPRLHTDGNTVDWLSKQGKARLMYPKAYNKAYELALHSLPKFKRKYGVTSKQYKYVARLIDYCEKEGVVRFEQELHHELLAREELQFWGLLDESKLKDIHKEFIELDKRLQVTAMTLETISETLLSSDICKDTRSANATAFHAYNWYNGQKFDKTKSQSRLHRTRLRKIGIDIARPCNISRFSPVYTKQAREVNASPCAVPTWYEMPRLLKAV